ncbi:MAG: ComF family protein [Calditrichaceae bacterium]
MITSRIYDLFIEPVIAFALPAFCIECEGRLENGRKIICPDCYNKLPLLPKEYAGVLLKEIKNPFFDELYIKFQFTELCQKLIHHYKYQRKLTLAKYFAASIVNLFDYDDIHMIVGIPLNPAKQRERGYNQSALIVNELSGLLNIPADNSIVKRIKNTPSQTKLNRKQRIENMRNAFVCTIDLRGKNIVLLDDIITTGSTLNACAEVLKKQGAAKVTAVALATPTDILQQNLEKDLSELNRF